MAKKQAYDYEAMEEQLEGRTAESYERKESSNSRQMALALPEGHEMWNATEGTHYIDIIPFFAGANNPQCKEGEATYVLDYWVHQNVGPAKETICCPQQTLNYRGVPQHLVEQYGRRCPICEYRNKLIEDGHDPKSKPIKALKAKRRVAYNVVNYDKNEEIAKGIQILEGAHFFYEKNIISISKSERTGGIIAFSSPRKERGRTIKFEKVGKGENVAYQGFVLEPRDYDIDPEIMESALSLDEYLVYMTFDEIKDKFFDGLEEEESLGADDGEAQPEPATERKPGRVAGGYARGGATPKDSGFDPDAEALTTQATDEDAPPPPLDAGEEDQPEPPVKKPAPRQQPPARQAAPAARQAASQSPARQAPKPTPAPRQQPAPQARAGVSVRRRPAQDSED